MIEVQVKPHLKNLTRLSQEVLRVYGKTRHDVKRLGLAGYSYLKSFIPVSNLSQPHLRDSFKVKTAMISGGVLLTITTNKEYAPFVDQGTVVPTRYPKTKKVMKFDVGGKTVFTRKAKGFRTRGIHYVDKTEAWLVRNVWNYVDITLRRYLKSRSLTVI